MTYAPFIGWLVFAGVASVPLWKMLFGIVEWESPGAVVKIGGPTFLVLSFVGGAAISIGGGGPSAKGIAVPGGGGGPAAGSFNFAIYDMKDAGISSDTICKQGFPMLMGEIDTAHVVDSVEVVVDGAEVGASAVYRPREVYPDGSARVIYVQFRANPSTESSGQINFSGATVDSVRITEQSWQTTDTAYAQLNSGDSTGIRIWEHGYHDCMAFASDSGRMVDTYPLPLATIEEYDAISETTIRLALDTMKQRYIDYGDFFWDTTSIPARLSGETPNSGAWTDFSILVDASVLGMNNCTDWTSTANSYLNFRQGPGQSSNTHCRGDHNYYDMPKVRQQYGHMLGGGSATGIEHWKRGAAQTFYDLMYYNDRIGGGHACYHSQFNRRSLAWSIYDSYVHTGDPNYRGQINCVLSNWAVTGARIASIGNADDGYGADPRVVGYTLNWTLAGYLSGAGSADWAVKVDTIVTQIVYGRDGTVPGDGSPVAYSNGIMAAAEGTADCVGTYDPNARPTNSEFHQGVLATALANAYRIMGKDRFGVGTPDTAVVSTVIAEIADTFGIERGLWVNDSATFANHFNGQSCSNSAAWSTNIHGIQTIHAPGHYIDYALNGASLHDADSLLQRISVSRTATTKFTGAGTEYSGNTAYTFANAWYSWWEAIGWRTVGQGN